MCKEGVLQAQGLLPLTSLLAACQTGGDQYLVLLYLVFLLSDQTIFPFANI